MNWALFAYAAFYVIGALVYVSQIGQPRDPISPSDAVVVLSILAGICTLLILAGLRLT